MQAQVIFNALGPDKPIVTGESFIIQYKLNNAEKTGSFTPPSFNGFRLVGEPYFSSRTETENGRLTEVRIYTVALEALRPGSFLVSGASVVVNGKTIRSNPVAVTVISKKNASVIEAGANDQVLLPGENPYEKIRQNLFLKVMVDRRSCYIGEPVLATFKLYSRLESKSDIVKNPGFYGFTVYDMINLADQQSATEIINGKIFEVHTVRQVQLYPLQAGSFTIDAMEVKNEVEFSKSRISKKTEQEITENAEEDNKPRRENVYENTISTEPATITVKSVPEKNKPSAYNGACGDFKINAVLVSNHLASNEQGFLDVIISGKGNFTQLNAPEIKWPAGIEGFEPITADTLNKFSIPLQGSRTFRYPFISSAPGTYQLPAVSFHFFNPASNGYKTAISIPVSVSISNETMKQDIVVVKNNDIRNVNAKASKTAFIIILSLILAGLVYWILQRKKPEPEQKMPVVAVPAPEEVMQRVEQNILLPAKGFCSILSASLWDYFRDCFALQGTGMNKEGLYSLLIQKGIGNDDIDKLKNIFAQCEAAAFTSAELEMDNETMLKDAKEIIEVINRSLL